MTYKLKESPEKVYWCETKQFTIVDEEGREYEIQIHDNSKGSEWLMWYEPGGWDEIIEVPILDYLEEEFDSDESSLDYEFSKQEDKKMDEVYDKFVSENGELKDFKQFHDLVSEMMRVQNNKKSYYETHYYATRRLKNRMGL